PSRITPIKTPGTRKPVCQPQNTSTDPSRKGGVFILSASGLVQFSRTQAHKTAPVDHAPSRAKGRPSRPTRLPPAPASAPPALVFFSRTLAVPHPTPEAQKCSR